MTPMAITQPTSLVCVTASEIEMSVASMKKTMPMLVFFCQDKIRLIKPIGSKANPKIDEAVLIPACNRLI
jgi:hypothetical protein